MFSLLLSCLLDVDPLVVPLELGHNLDKARVDAEVEGLVAPGVSGSDHGGYDRLCVNEIYQYKKEATKPRVWSMGQEGGRAGG